MRKCAVILVLGVLAGLLPTVASAAELRQGGSTIVASGETIEDDLYVFGGAADIAGTVNGDVVFFGGTSTIGGRVTGDVLVLGGTTNVSGDVSGSLRALGGTINVSGSVGQDAVVGAGALNLAPTARIGRDLVAGVGGGQIAAAIGRNALVGGGELSLDGPVGGDVRAEADTLRLGSAARVQGTLSYASGRDAQLAAGASVAGGIQRTETRARPDVSAPLGGMPALAAAAGAVVWLRGLVGIALLGLLCVWLFPATMRRTTAGLAARFGASLGIGALLLVGVPILATLVVAVGLLIGGWWLGLLLLVFYALALGLGYVVSAILVGSWVIQRTARFTPHLATSLLLGIVLLGVASLLPPFGALISALAMTAGLGALGICARDAYTAQRRARRADVTPAPAGVAVAPA
jgi:hypothetical protein